ncbi:hypothetical protein [Pseudomonas putida]|uniref:hypothetical protein n=1 Tax=Pseudomonas TaxID=286 RepID=UPI003465E8B4
MVINIQDVWADAAADHARFLKDTIDKGLVKLGGTSVELAVVKFVIDNKDSIVNGVPSDLALCIKKYIHAFPDLAIRKVAVGIMGKIFDYGAFSAKSDKPWTAYHLCSLARYKVCCYCHMVETGTCLPDEDTKGYRPPIDHYYGKAEYPFLALSLCNFIPCCEKCNGPQMKGKIDFSESIHLNPLVDEESIEFALVPVQAADTKIAEFAAFSLPKDQYRLSVIAIGNHKVSASSIKTFQLTSRYANYSERAYYLAKRLRGLPARQRFYDEGLDFKVGLEEHLEFEPEEYKNVPYGKARICIAKQFGVDIP